MEDRKSHWDNVFKTKSSHEVSWTQDVPLTSLEMIRQLKLPKTAQIIDVGGGDSKLVDNLLNEGFKNISILDISSEAFKKVKYRLGKKASLVNWIVSDILDDTLVFCLITGPVIEPFPLPEPLPLPIQ